MIKEVDMILMDVVFALIIALLLVLIFTIIFRAKPPDFGSVAFFLIVFLSSWAGGIWLTPIGPVSWGVYWLPFLLVGVMVALLLAAVHPPPKESTVELVDLEKRKARRWTAASSRARFVRASWRLWAFISGSW